MNFDDKEFMSARLTKAESQAIIDARIYEKAADKLRECAKTFRQQANLLADARHELWCSDSPDEEDD